MRSVRTHGRSAPGGLDAFPLQRCKNLHSGRARAPRRRCLPAGLRARYAFWWRGRAVGEIFLAASSGSLGICRLRSQFSKIAVREFLRWMGNLPGHLRQCLALLCTSPQGGSDLQARRSPDGQITARLREDREQGWNLCQKMFDTFGFRASQHRPQLLDGKRHAPSGRHLRGNWQCTKAIPGPPAHEQNHSLETHDSLMAKALPIALLLKIGALAKGHDPRVPPSRAAWLLLRVPARKSYA